MVLEKASTPGGNLSTIIPDFRLPSEVVEQEISWIERWGIQIRTGVHVGEDISVSKLLQENQAVILATGTNRPITLDICGENAVNIHHARAFLEAVKQGKHPELGKSVIVIGGGNSALDSAQTAMRLGTVAVTIICLERKEELPAYASAVSEALEEGITFEWGWGPIEFACSENGCANAVECHRCISVWDGGRFAPLLDRGAQKRFEADSILIAIGDRSDSEYFEDIGLLPSTGTKPAVDQLTLETTVTGLFVAGDCFSGPTSVVEAMASGKRVAVSVDRKLRGEDLKYGRSYIGPFITEFSVDAKKTKEISRQPLPQLALKDRKSFKEVNIGYDEALARLESSRCLSCGVPVGYYDACWYCLPCEVSCPEQALKVEVPYIIR
jgi:NADPH-dependent glutamate synthase beta subunit-like oxidoreductase